MHWWQQTKREYDLLREQSDDAVEFVKIPKGKTMKAVLLLTLGTVLAAVFADPLVDAVDNFSSATRIPPFFISFIALPLATNASEAVSAVIFASRKKLRSASLTFSEVCFFISLIYRVAPSLSVAPHIEKVALENFNCTKLVNTNNQVLSLI